MMWYIKNNNKKVKRVHFKTCLKLCNKSPQITKYKLYCAKIRYPTQSNDPTTTKFSLFQLLQIHHLNSEQPSNFPTRCLCHLFSEKKMRRGSWWSRSWLASTRERRALARDWLSTCSTITTTGGEIARRGKWAFIWCF